MLPVMPTMGASPPVQQRPGQFLHGAERVRHEQTAGGFGRSQFRQRAMNDGCTGATRQDFRHKRMGVETFSVNGKKQVAGVNGA
jgi:hypothetical protein